jgi:hypothetical protein
MQFMMFVCRDADTVERGTDAPSGAAVEEWVNRMDAAGRCVLGGPLASESETTSVRVRDGEHQVSGGAVVRTSNALLGFDVLECRDTAEAIAIAAEHPLAARGVLELRAMG